MAINYPQRYDDDFINIIKKVIDHVNEYGKTIQDLVADGQLTEGQYANLLTTINGMVKSGEVKESDLTTNLRAELRKIEEKPSYNEVRLRTEKIETEDMSDALLSAISGGGTVNVLSIPQDNSVTPKKTTFVKVVSNNLFNKGTISTNKAVDPTTGNIIDNDWHSISEMIDVMPNVNYVIRNSTGLRRVGFYNLDGDYIDKIEPTTNPVDFTTPENCYGMIVQMQGTSDNSGDALQVNVGTTPLPYDEFALGMENIRTVEGLVDNKVFGLVSVLDFGAKADWNGVDGTDDTDAIQSAIDYVNSIGGGTVVFPYGKYLISGTIYTYSNITLWGFESKLHLDDNATLDSHSLGTNVMSQETFIYSIITTPYYTNTENVVIKGIGLDGNGSNQVDYEGYYNYDIGIGLFNCVNGIVKECHVSNVGNVLHGMGVQVTDSDSCKIVDNIVEGSGYENIAVKSGSRNIIVDGNIMKDGRNHNIQVSTFGGIKGCENIIISNNTLINGKFISHGFDNAVNKNIVFANNTIDNKAGVGVHILYATEGIIVEGNTIDASEPVRIEPEFASTMTHVTVNDNNITSDGVAIDIREAEGTGVIRHLNVKGNNVKYTRGFNGSCIHLRVQGGAEFVVIEGNNVTAYTDSLSMRVIHLDRVSSNVSVANNIIETNYDGIVIGGDAKGVTCSGNHVKGTTSNATGIKTTETSDDVLITSNNLIGVSNSNNRIINESTGTNIVSSGNLA